MITTNQQPSLTANNVQPIAATPEMVTSNVEEKLQQLMTEKLGLEEAQLQPDVSFAKDLGIDSLDVFELLISVESLFQITIPAEEAEKLTTPGKLVNYIKNIHPEN